MEKEIREQVLTSLLTLQARQNLETMMTESAFLALLSTDTPIYGNIELYIIIPV